jgi:hypothetical protein
MILGQHTLLKLLFLILLILALSSCSSNKEKVEAAMDENEANEGFEPSVEVKAREPLYIYENHPDKIGSKEVDLGMNKEPLLLSSGYVRLVGVVSGGKPLALVEVGGRGLCLEPGEELGEYKVMEISEKSVRLIRKGE